MRSHWDQLEESLRRRKCGRDIMGYVTIFKYPKFATLAASGLLEEARAEDPTQYARLASQVSQRDGRTIQEYARDVIAGWVVEDSVLFWLNSHGVATRRAGVDGDRSFAWSRNITNKADFIITDDGREYPCELAATYDDSWTRYDSVWLRCNKQQHVFDQGALLLGADMYTGRFVTISPWQDGLSYDDFYKFGKMGRRIFWPNGMKGAEYETNNDTKIRNAIKAYEAQYDKWAGREA